MIRITVAHDASTRHPETGIGEIFVSNMHAAQFEAFRWKSKRMGLIAYDGEGRQLAFPNWSPVFVQETELPEQGQTLSELRRSLQEQRRAA